MLKDGASAIYGSDAIAGVINFILRQEFSGLELTAEYGDHAWRRATQAGHAEPAASATWPPTASTSCWSASLPEGRRAVRPRPRLRRRGVQRRDHQRTTHLGQHLPGPTSRSADGSGGQRPIPPHPAAPLPVLLQRPAVPARPLPLRPVAVGDAGFRPPSASASSPPASTRSRRDIQAFVEASYNENKIRTVIQPVPLSDQFNIPLQNALCSRGAVQQHGRQRAASRPFLLTPSSPYYPTAFATARTTAATPDLLVRYRSALTGNRDITDISEAPRVVAGVKGTRWAGTSTSPGLYSQSKVREKVSNGFPLLTQLMPLLNSGHVQPVRSRATRRSRPRSRRHQLHRRCVLDQVVA